MGSDTTGLGRDQSPLPAQSSCVLFFKILHVYQLSRKLDHVLRHFRHKKRPYRAEEFPEILTEGLMCGDVANAIIVYPNGYPSPSSSPSLSPSPAVCVCVCVCCMWCMWSMWCVWCVWCMWCVWYPWCGGVWGRRPMGGTYTSFYYSQRGTMSLRIPARTV